MKVWLLGTVAAVVACGPGLENDPLPASPGIGAAAGTMKGPDAGAGSGGSSLTGNVEQRQCGVLGADGVRALAFLPDGKTLAVGYASGRIGFLAPATATRLRTIDAHLVPVAKLVASPNGTTLASPDG